MPGCRSRKARARLSLADTTPNARCWAPLTGRIDKERRADGGRRRCLLATWSRCSA